MLMAVRVSVLVPAVLVVPVCVQAAP